MPALLINIKIENEKKYNLFKNTLIDLKGLFSECHIKFRGSYSVQCIKYVNKIFNSNESLTFYQDLKQDDWVDATLSMINRVKNRSVFLYFEDHKLVSTRQHFEEVIKEFDTHRLDYLCYSFFKASSLGLENLLPLNPKKRRTVHTIEYSKKQAQIIGKISPCYYHFSLISICSVEYFKSILIESNRKFKIYNKTVSSILSRIFPYPKHRKFENLINIFLNKFNVYLCSYTPASPFNLEKIWFEDLMIRRSLRFGFLTNELYANSDDDNGHYMESIVKRGLYPLVDKVEQSLDCIGLNGIYFKLTLQDGEIYDCTYFSRNGRISSPPIVRISVDSGKINVKYQTSMIYIERGDCEYFFSNKSPIIKSVGLSQIIIGVFDECF
jgi:hypothetical protein